MAPTPVLLPGESQGWGSLVGCRRIPGTEEPGGLPSVGSHGVGHDWSDSAAAAEMSRSCFCRVSSVTKAPWFQPYFLHLHDTTIGSGALWLSFFICKMKATEPASRSERLSVQRNTGISDGRRGLRESNVPSIHSVFRSRRRSRCWERREMLPGGDLEMLPEGDLEFQVKKVQWDSTLHTSGSDGSF